MEVHRQEHSPDEGQGQVQTCKVQGQVQQPHTGALVQVHTGVGVETHRKGVAPHTEEGVHCLRADSTWAKTEERSNLVCRMT